MQFNASGAADIIPLYDVTPAIIMGSQSLIILTLSILMMFTYIPQDKTYVGLGVISDAYRGLGQFPVNWFWNAMNTYNSQRWMAASYFVNFLMAALIAGIELIAFGLYMTGSPELAYLYTPTIGFYGSVFGYVVSPMFALIYMTQARIWGGLEKKSYEADYTNSIFMCACGFLQLYVAVVSHFLYTDRYVAYGRANFGKKTTVVAEVAEVKVEEITTVDIDVPFNSNSVPESNEPVSAEDDSVAPATPEAKEAAAEDEEVDAENEDAAEVDGGDDTSF